MLLLLLSLTEGAEYATEHMIRTLWKPRQTEFSYTEKAGALLGDDVTGRASQFLKDFTLHVH